MPCGTTCSNLWLEEHRPIPKQPTSYQLHSELTRLRQKSGLLPRIGGATGILSKVSVVAAAGYTGWQIGTGIRKLWMGSELPVESPDGWTLGSPTPELIKAGTSIGSGIVAPVDGWSPAASLMIYDLHPGSKFPPPSCVPYETVAPPAFGGWDVLVGPQQSFEVECGTGIRHLEALFAPLLMSNGTGTGPGGVEDYVSQPINPHAWPAWNSWGAGEGYPATPTSGAQVVTRVQDELANHPGDYPTLILWYKHQFDPENNPDPLAVPIPDCTGLSYNACVTLIQDAGFGVVEVEKRSFNEAVPMPQAEAQEVFGTTPSAGTKVRTDTEVLIDANPDEEDMPRLVPNPLAREDRIAYGTRIEALGLNVTYQAVPEEQGDPARGPNEATGANPAPGERVHKDDSVQVRHNPETWPNPGPGPGGGGSCDAPSIRAFNLEPLNVPLGTLFPFGLFGWLLGIMESWLATPVAPSWTLPLVGDIEWTIDFAFLEPLMLIIRPCLLIVSVLGVVWMLAASAIRIRGDIGD